MVLGTYHFDNPGLDQIQMEVADIRSEAKQREVAEVVDRLATFRPTVVAVEVPSSRQARLDSLYRAFRSGRHELEESETQQLGFRLAVRLELARVVAVDHRLNLPYGPYQSARQDQSPDIQARYDAFVDRLIAEDDSLQRTASLREILRVDNTPERIRAIHDALYLQSLEIGAGDGFEGADLVAAWYERNLKIFANLAATSQPGDRVVLIIGAGHTAILRSLVEQASWMRLVEPRDVL